MSSEGVRKAPLHPALGQGHSKDRLANCTKQKLDRLNGGSLDLWGGASSTFSGRQVNGSGIYVGSGLGMKQQQC